MSETAFDNEPSLVDNSTLPETDGTNSINLEGVFEGDFSFEASDLDLFNTADASGNTSGPAAPAPGEVDAESSIKQETGADFRSSTHYENPAGAENAHFAPATAPAEADASLKSEGSDEDDDEDDEDDEVSLASDEEEEGKPPASANGAKPLRAPEGKEDAEAEEEEEEGDDDDDDGAEDGGGGEAKDGEKGKKRARKRLGQVRPKNLSTTYLPVCLSVCLPICLPACLSVHLSSACLPACLPACLLACLSFCLFIHLSVHLSLYAYPPARPSLQPCALSRVGAALAPSGIRERRTAI